MSRRGYLPQKPVTIVTENGDEAMIESVRVTAEQALATGQNAQQMVRNRDPRLDAVESQTLTLQQLTDDYRARLAESLEQRAALTAKVAAHDAELAALQAAGSAEAEARQAGDARAGADLASVSERLDRIQLIPGPPGQSAYDLAQAAGYTGTQAQWLASLKGDPGTPGAPGKDIDPAVAAALSTRIKALEDSRPLAYGMTATPVLALLAQVDLVVPLSREMPDAGYTIELAKTANIRDDMLTVKAKTRTSVTYTLRALVALGAGTVAVIARY